MNTQDRPRQGSWYRFIPSGRTLCAMLVVSTVLGMAADSAAQALSATVRVLPGDRSTFPTDPPLNWYAQCFYPPPYPDEPPHTGENAWFYAASPSGWWVRRCSGYEPTMADVSIEVEQASFRANVIPNDSRYFLTHTGGSTGAANVWHLWARQGTAKGTVSNIDGSPAPGVPVAVFSGDWHTFERSTVTNSRGEFDFTETDPLSQLNHWGLDVDEEFNAAAATIGGSRFYSFMAGTPGDPSVPHYGPGATGAVVTSSHVTTVNLTAGVPEKKKDVDNKGEGNEARPPRPGEDECKSRPPQAPRSVGEPVNLFTGNVSLSQTDVALPGVARTLALTRTYNSQDAINANVGAFGRGWTHALEKTVALVPATSSLMRLITSDGSPIYYADADGDLTYRAVLPASEQSWLVKSGSVFTRHFAEGDSEVFDERGLLTTQVDRWGHETSLAYDAEGHLSSITHPGGRALVFSYSAGRVTEVLGPAGTLATYTYSGDLLSEVTYADGSGYAFVYDDAGQILSVTDRSGTVLETHTYDTQGRALTSEGGGGRERLSFAYVDGQTLVTDAFGKTTSYRYGGTPRQVFEIEGPCPTCGGTGETQRWYYDTLGRIERYTNGAGEATDYTYDASGFVASIRDALGRTTAFTRDNLGRVLTETRPGGVVTTWTHGAAGPLTITDASGRTTQVGYNTAGLLETVTDPAGKSTSFGYNGQGDLVSMTDSLGHTTTFAYDLMGRRTSVSDALGHTTSITHDLRGRVTSQTLADGTHSDLGYDLGGRLVTLTDALGRVTRRSYDASGALSAVEDPLKGATRYGYDAMSRLTSLTDARGHATRFEYDNHGQLVRQVFPDGKDEGYSYTVGGRLESKTDRRGIIRHYVYDGIGRLVEQTFSDGTPSIRSSYDAAGRVATVSNGSDALRWTYESAGRVLTESSGNGNTALTSTYDTAGRRSSVGLTGSPATGYSYDDAGRLTGLTRGGASFAMGYDEADRRTSLTFPNGVATSYSYDSVDRLTELVAARGGTMVASHGYTYDAAGNRTSRMAPALTEQYGYDALDRLVRVDRPGASAERSVFTYDPVGNRTATQAGTTVISATHDSGNRLTAEAVGGPLLVRGSLNEAGSVAVNGQAARLLAGNVFEATIPASPGTNAVMVVATDGQGNARTSHYEVDVAGRDASYTYDPAGNLIQKTESGHDWTYEWNALNQLVRVTRDGAEMARFTYDPLGRRIEKLAGGVRTAYVYDGEDILRETRSDGATFDYVHGPGIDEPLARIDSSGATEYYHADGLGSVVKTTDAAGAVRLTRQYDVWGNLEVGASEPGYAFTGREWDPEVGLYYYRARYYDPTVGRFVSEDPIRLSGGVNFYAYVGGNPVNGRDPFGLVDPYPGFGLGRAIAMFWWHTKDYPDARTQAWADQNNVPKSDGGNVDAYRHCFASCIMARSYGQKSAEALGWANEAKGDAFGQGPTNRNMDEYNNKKGRCEARSASSDEDCWSRCGGLLSRGHLQVLNP